MKRNSINNDFIFLSMICAFFIIGTLCLFTINYDDMFIKPKTHSMMWRYWNSGKFKYQNGIYLDFMAAGIFTILIWLKPEIFKIKVKDTIIKKIKEGVKEFKIWYR